MEKEMDKNPEAIQVKINGTKIEIGEFPKIIADMETDENYLEVSGKRVPYYHVVRLSPDLLEGKRPEVLGAAIRYYYEQALRVAEGILAAEEYRKKANFSVRNKK